MADDAATVEQLRAENARLRAENAGLHQANAAVAGERSEAVEQQTATQQILRAIAASPVDVQQVLNDIAEAAARLGDADRVLIHRVDGDEMWGIAHSGTIPISYAAARSQMPDRTSIVGRAIVDRRTVYVNGLTVEDDEFPKGASVAREMGNRSTMATPLLRDGVVIGALHALRQEVRPFTPVHIRALESFADQAVIAIENARLFEALQARTAELTSALEQQTATADVLRVIASAPADLQMVLNTIAEAAARLCGADDAILNQVMGDSVALVAGWGSVPRLPLGALVPLNRGVTSGRAILDRRPVRRAGGRRAGTPDHGGPLATVGPARHAERAFAARRDADRRHHHPPHRGRPLHGRTGSTH